MPTQSDQANVADLLRTYRHAAGLTQEQLADTAGLSARAIQDLERGLSTPRRDTIQRIVRALGLTDQQRRDVEAAIRPRPRSRASRAGGQWALAAPDPTVMPRQLLT